MKTKTTNQPSILDEPPKPTLLDELYAERDSREREIQKLEERINELIDRIEYLDDQIRDEELKPEDEEP